MVSVPLGGHGAPFDDGPSTSNPPARRWAPPTFAVHDLRPGSGSITGEPEGGLNYRPS